VVDTQSGKSDAESFTINSHCTVFLAYHKSETGKPILGRVCCITVDRYSSPRQGKTNHPRRSGRDGNGQLNTNGV